MPVTDFEVKEKYRYLNGFDCYLETESVRGTLPVGQNSPQKPAHGLYAEKLSGTSFTAPRHESKQTWLYRVLPACTHPPFEPAAVGRDGSTNGDRGDGAATAYADVGSVDGRIGSGGRPALHFLPNQLRWDPFDGDPSDTSSSSGGGGDDFVSGLRLVAGAGDPTLKQGLGIYSYAARRSMAPRHAFYSADGDLLVVPQRGALDVRTELGSLLVRPMEVAVIPRGVRYRVDLVGDEPGEGGPARGYALELYQGHFALPELGPIGSNGLANPRDFQVPVACFDDPTPSSSSDASGAWTITAKFAHTLHATRQPHSPFDVVGWHGTYYPYKYDLGRFNTIGSISYDHPDPSIFTVLTAPSIPHGPGHAVADFVIFPPRWLVAEHTFRPPYYHRNTMAEFMGLISGDYDAKRGGKGGFQPGGASLHNVMAGHGPDAESGEAARNADPTRPVKVGAAPGAGSCAFMFETCLMLGVSEWGLKTCQKVQQRYSEESWGALKVHWKMPEGAKVESHLAEAG